MRFAALARCGYFKDPGGPRLDVEGGPRLQVHFQDGIAALGDPLRRQAAHLGTVPVWKTGYGRTSGGSMR